MTQSLASFSLAISSLAIAFSPVMGETTPNAIAAYPPEYVQDYLQECQATSIREGLGEAEATNLCGCTLKEFQAKYTLEEFKQLNKLAETDSTASDALMEVGQFCFEQILYEE